MSLAQRSKSCSASPYSPASSLGLPPDDDDDDHDDNDDNDVDRDNESSPPILSPSLRCSSSSPDYCSPGS